MHHRNLFGLTLAASLVLLFAVAGRTLAASSAAAEYKDFGREVAQVVSKMKEVAVNDRERSDLRALEFLFCAMTTKPSLRRIGNKPTL